MRVRRVGLWVAVLYMLCAGLAIAQPTGGDKSAAELILNPGPQRLQLLWQRSLDFDITLEGSANVIVPEGFAVRIPKELTQGATLRAYARVTIRPQIADVTTAAVLSVVLNELKLTATTFGHRVDIAGDKQRILATVDEKVLFDSTKGAMAILPIAQLVFGQEVVTLRVTPGAKLLGFAAVGILATLTGDETDPFAGINQALKTMPNILPRDPVKLFEGWSVEWPLNSPALGIQASSDAHFRLESFTVVNNRLCAKVTGRARFAMQEFDPVAAFQSIPIVGSAVPKDLGPSVKCSAQCSAFGSLLLDVQASELVGVELGLDLDGHLITDEKTPPDEQPGLTGRLKLMVTRGDSESRR